MPAYDFSADDIFELAEDIEKNGMDFYTNAADKVEAESHRKLLLDLAAMELTHKKIFAQMRKELAENERTSGVFDPEEETVAYLKALADIRVFFQKPIDTSSMENILKSAITAEKDSIVLYLGMKEMIPDKAGKGRIDNIIKEEMGHIRLLSGELRKL
jgi:rubrerythrin